jgi:hypothetical protein
VSYPIPYLYILVLFGCKLTQNIAISQLFRQKADFAEKKFLFYFIDLQVDKKNGKKKSKKKAVFVYNVSKKCVTLHRFKKANIVLQIKKAKEMKKLAFLFAAFVAVSFASCGNKAEQAAEENDSISDSIGVVDSASVDSVAADSVAADSAAI